MFPKDFTWGAAAASYQIEGAATADGKGLSVWDMMCRKEGAIWNGQSGDTACDHYNRYREDAAMMKTMGLQAYRLSLSWPRIQPAGTGPVNKAGLDFYSRLIDELLKNDVTPWVTLFHWDYPYDLYCRGGWLNPDSPRWFADYTAIVVDALSDRVRHWITLNEPQCFIGLGLNDGIHAPGDKLGLREVLRAGHNALLAHGQAVMTIRERTKQPCEVGIAPCGGGCFPATESEADIAAARAAMYTVPERSLWRENWWTDPVYLGRYPEESYKLMGDAAPVIGQDDMHIICRPLDFFGTNIYHASRIRADANGNPEPVAQPPGKPLTLFHWPLTPEALRWAPRFYYERYKLPVVITENGLSGMDWVALDGRVHDPQRIDYTTRYLRAFAQAGADGVPIKGYFHWSVMDNFEWAEGHKHRFGLVHVDFQTQKRTLKDSAYWYRDVIQSNGKLIV